MPKPLSEIKNAKNFMGMFVGESGSGKSVAGASFAVAGKMIVNDFDRRIMGVASAVEQKIISSDNIFVEEYGVSDFKLWSDFLEGQLGSRKAGVLSTRTIQVSSLHAFSRLFKTQANTQFGDARKLGKSTIFNLDGQSSFNAEISGTHQSLDVLRMLDVNIIFDSQLIPRWGKLRFDDKGDPITALGEKIESKEQLDAAQRGSNEVIGEMLNVRPNYAVGVLAAFNNVFVFSREKQGKEMKYLVEFSTEDLGKNIYGIKPGKHEYTGRSFFEYFSKLTGGEGK